MRVSVNEKMKNWVRDYIRTNREQGCISIHCIFSKFNENFEAMFGLDPRAATTLMIAEGFLFGRPSFKGFSIWLPEDSGKGKSRPSRSRQPIDVTPQAAIAVATVETQLEQSTTTDQKKQNGEIEMEEMTFGETEEFHYAFERIVDPETGKVIAIQVLLHRIVSLLATKLPTNPEMDGGYAIGKIKFTNALKEAGVPRGQCPEISRILQEMCLVRPYGRGQWGVLHTKAANYFITARSYEHAKGELLARQRRNAEITKLRMKLKAVLAKPDEVVSAPVSLSPAVLDEEAITALLEAERIAMELLVANTRIEELLSERDNLAAMKQSREYEVAKQSLANAQVRITELELALNKEMKFTFQERLAVLKKVSAVL